MGKFKEIAIDKSNESFNEENNKINFDIKRIIINNNGEDLSLEEYLKVAQGIIYVVAPKDRLHLWGWNDFKEKIDGRLLDYEVEGKKILYQIFECKNEIIYEVLEEFGLYISRRLK